MHIIANTRFAETIGLITTHLDQLPGGCDPDFDAGLDELEREFAELRLHLASE
jgi:hypothetical protein